MKIFKVTTVYPSYLTAFYSGKSGIEHQSFAEQKHDFDYDAFGWADFWSTALKPLGYDVFEVSANVESMQKAWAAENGVPVSENWLLDIPLAQIKHFQPDVLFVDDYSTFKPEWIKAAKDTCPSIRLVLGWCGAPYDDLSTFKEYDLVLSCIPEMVDDFRKSGLNAAHLNHSFDPRILTRINRSPETVVDFSFIGQIVRGKSAHNERERTLIELRQKTPLEIFSPLYYVDSSQQLKAHVKQATYLLTSGMIKLGIPDAILRSLPGISKARTWKSMPALPMIPELREVLHPPVFGLKMFETLARSKVTFNKHIDASPFSASNMRMFEATGSGTCLMTDAKRNIRELFEPDYEVVTYETTGECIEKVRWLLDHPAEQKAIAQKGQERCLKEHTFTQRAPTLDRLIRKNL